MKNWDKLMERTTVRQFLNQKSTEKYKVAHNTLDKKRCARFELDQNVAFLF